MARRRGVRRIVKQPFVDGVKQEDFLYVVKY